MKKPLAHICIVEDDDTIRELLDLNLRKNEFSVDAFFSIEQLVRKNDPMNYDILLLDIMLPGESGLSFAKKLKEKNIHVPILIISALGQEEKIKSAYDAGVIDYIVKPFEIEHLIHKIRNLLFYFARRQASALPVKIGSCQIDWDLMQVHTGKEIHALTPKEAKILIYFLENPDKVITRDELMKNIWGENVFVTSRNIDNFLVKFRKWFEARPSAPEMFITYPKKGYAYIPRKPD